MNPSDINFGQSDFWTWDAPMYEQLRWLRENAPIFLSLIHI